MPQERMSGGRGFNLQSAKFMQVENTRAETLAWSPPESNTGCVGGLPSAIFDPVHVLRDAREGDGALRLMYLWKVRAHRHCKGDYNTISGPPPATRPRLYDLQCSCDQPWSFLHPATSFKDVPEYKIIFKHVGRYPVTWWDQTAMLTRWKEVFEQVFRKRSKPHFSMFVVIACAQITVM